MSKTFHLTPKQAPELLIQQAKAAAKKHGVTLKGDAGSGRFAGTGIEGQYSVDGQTLAITISKKPMIMPWVVVEKTITAIVS